MPTSAGSAANAGLPGRAGQEFDPYAQWLDIPADHRPPTYYDLLGLRLLEEDQVRIQQAALDRLAHVRKYQLSQHGEQALRLLDLMSKAYVCLTDPALKAQYDQQLLASHAQRFAHWPQPPEGSWAVVESTYPQDGSVPTEPALPTAPVPLITPLLDAPPLERLKGLARLFRAVAIVGGSAGLTITLVLAVRGEHPLIWLATLVLAALSVCTLFALAALLDTTVAMYQRIERRLDQALARSAKDRQE